MTTKSERDEVRMARLPQWARTEIERLRAEVMTLEKRVTVGPEDSDTFVVGYSMPDTPLGDRVTVRFELDPGAQRTGYIEAGIQAGTWAGGRVLTVRGSDGIEVLPASGNMMLVRLAEQR